MLIILILLLLAGAAACLVLLTNRYPQSRLPVAAYCGTYFLTTFLGAAVAGWYGVGVLESLNYGLDVALLGPLGDATYWIVLFGPFIIPPLVAFGVLRLSGGGAETPEAAPLCAPWLPAEESLDLTLFNVWFVLLAGYCIGVLYSEGLLGNIGTFFDRRGDYTGLMEVRFETTSRAGRIFPGLVYVGLPILTCCALYEFARTRLFTWGLTLAVTFLVCSFLCLSLITKGHLLIYMVVLNLGLLTLKIIRWRSMGLMVFAGVSILTFLQTFYSEEWTTEQTISLVAYRMAVSFPYYLQLYPAVLPYCGVDLGLHLVGLEHPKTYSGDVAQFMYPGSPLECATPSTSHMSAIAEAGLPYCFVILVVTGVCLALVTRLRNVIRGPYSFAFYLASLLFLYYLTQTSFRESLISCYGIFWGATVLAPLFLVGSFLHPSRDPAVGRKDYPNSPPWRPGSLGTAPGAGGPAAAAGGQGLRGRLLPGTSRLAREAGKRLRPPGQAGRGGVGPM